jgi:signal transduction histidine kinase
LEERQRLARDLHDAVSQTLFSAGLTTEILLRNSDSEAIREDLEELHALTRGAQAEMRTLLLELRPSALAEAGLEDLLVQLVTVFTGRTGVPVDINIDIPANYSYVVDVKIALYRIVQESLNNIVKHAEASKVGIMLRKQRKHEKLSIIDNGRGFDLENYPMDRLGISSLHERAKSIEANLTINSTPGQGTEVIVIW